MDSKTLKIGVDIGGTNLRVGFLRARDMGLVDVHAQAIHAGRRGPDIRAAVAHACGLIKTRTAALEKKGWRVVREAGVSAPGAYLKDGRVYPGTTPNIPDLARVKLYSLFAQGLGPGWRVTAGHVNNDGVLQGLVMASRYARAAGMKRGKIVAVIPGTGFGAGVYRVKGGVVSADPGPQQLFDVVVRPAGRGEPMHRGGPARGGEPMIVEHLVSGQALTRWSRGAFGKPVSGETLSRWALGRGHRSQAAQAIFSQVGRDLALFVDVVRGGNYLKSRVPHRPDTRGAAIFLVGGRWLLEGAGRRISFPTARRASETAKKGLIPADRIPGLRRIAPVLGLAGASLLVENNV